VVREGDPPKLITHYELKHATPDVDIIAIGNGGRHIWDENYTSHDDEEDGKVRDENAKGQYGWDEVLQSLQWAQKEGMKPAVEGQIKQEVGKPKEKPTPRAVKWLEDPRMLPRIVPSSRIMEFCYSQQHASIQYLRYLTERFLGCCSERSRVSKISGDSKPVRPVIFIAYGHGGLVLELAIMISYSTQLDTSSLNSPQVVERPRSSGLPSNEASASSPTTETSPSNVFVTPPYVIKAQAEVAQDEGQSSGFTTEKPKARLLLPTTERGDAANSNRGRLSFRAAGKDRRSSLVPGNERGPKESAHDKVDDAEASRPKPSLNLTLIAGILLLGSPLEVPMLFSSKGTNIWKLEDLVGEKSEQEPTLETLLDVCMTTKAFEKTIKTEYAGRTRSTIYHVCFERIVNTVGLTTQWYRGSPQFPMEAGNHFKVCWPVSIFISVYLSSTVAKRTDGIAAARCNQQIRVFACHRSIETWKRTPSADILALTILGTRNFVHKCELFAKNIYSSEQ
jgi:hypothetical protein